MFKKSFNKKYDKILKKGMLKCWKKAKVIHEDDNCYILLFHHINPQNLPNMTIAGLNKHTGKKGFLAAQRPIEELIDFLNN